MTILYRHGIYAYIKKVTEAYILLAFINTRLQLNKLAAHI